MPEPYKIVYQGGVGEIVEKKSRFIATVLPISTEEEALSFIEQMKKQYWDASHNCSAYTLGERHETARCSDDGEPQKTAGRPMLDVLLSEDVHNVCVVVTRYFGGTLLGTGGLVHAYSAAANGALRAAEIIRYDTYRRYNLITTYSDFQKIGNVFADFSFREEDSIYSDVIEIVGRVLSEDSELFEKKLVEITSGRIKIEKKDEIFDF